MKKKYLVTGGTGFVGSNLVRALVEKGEDISIIVRDKNLNWRIKDLNKKVNIYESEISDPKVSKIVSAIKPDYIFHLAAYGVLPSESDPIRMVDVNIKGTINLINAVKKNPFKLFINTGTSVEYGLKNSKMRESDVLAPINDYGVTKAAATLYAQKESVRNNLPIITFRLFTPYGYFEDRNRLIPSVVNNALRNTPIKVSVPTSVRDFIFIEDLVEAYLMSTKIKFNPGNILNIGTGRCFTIKEIVETVRKITNSNSKVVWGGVEKQERFIEPKKWEADISKTKGAIKWGPHHSLNQGLKKTVEWFKENQNLYE